MSEIGLYEAMSTLRAVRRLRPEPVPDAVLRRVLEAATWAPSGGNRQAWRLVVVRDHAHKGALGALYAEGWREMLGRYDDLLASLPEDRAAKERRALDAGTHLADHFAEVPVVVVVCFDPAGLAVTDADQPRVSVVGGGSIYPAVQNLLLACRAEGLGCVLTTLLCAREPEVKSLLGVPDEWGTAATIPIGYPVGRGHGKISRRPVEAMAFADHWGQPFG